MSSFAFDADDIAFGNGRAIVALGGRRFMFSNLTMQQTSELEAACRTGRLDRPDGSSKLFDALLARGIVRTIDEVAEARPHRARLRARIPSRWVAVAARALGGLTAPHMLALTISLIAVAGFSGAVAPAAIRSVSLWVTQVGLGDFVVAALAFSLCILVHETGHAAACQRRTGIVGAIRMQFYRGIPVFTTDVSSLCLATRSGKAAIALSGVLFQIAFSMLLLAVPVESVRMGATLSLLSAAFAIVPLPGSDGYWALRDLFGLKLVSAFPADERTSWTARIYTAWLILATGYFCFVLSREARVLLHFGEQRTEAALLRAAVLIGAAAYALLVAILFARRTVLFLKTSECGTR